MRYSVAALLAACVTIAQPAVAQPAANDMPVPVEKAAFHVPVFKNDLIAVLSVYIPPGRAAGYHIHSSDQISVVVREASNAGQVLGEQPYPARQTARGNPTFTAYSKKSLTHRVNNAGSTPFHNIVTAILYPQPGRFTAGSRADVPAYTQVIDNERVRIWRLTLEPGQTVAAITQGAPGLRIVVDEGEIAHIVAG